jgi:hypothetical protein
MQPVPRLPVLKLLQRAQPVRPLAQQIAHLLCEFDHPHLFR